MTGLPDVRPGQVWADNDKRCAGRHVLVLDVEPLGPGWAVVRQCQPDGQLIGRRVSRVRIDRMRPTSTGYRLVRDVTEEGQAP